MIIITSIIVLAILIVAFWNQPVYRYYIIQSEKVTNGFRIIQLSDLHNTSYGENNKRLIKKIKDKEPDIIVLTGDMVDDRYLADGAYALIKGLQEYPLYFVSGNHEHWHEDTYQVFEALEALGVIILKDEYVTIDLQGEQVNIAGLMDPAKIGYVTKRNEKEYYDAPLVNRLVKLDGSIPNKNETFTILLSHRPEFFESYMKFGEDLILCGHAHGGQVRIPFLMNGLYSPNQGWFPEYAGGMYTEMEKSMIVSRGLSLNPKLPRIFNPPEIVVIDIL